MAITVIILGSIIKMGIMLEDNIVVIVSDLGGHVA
jgi:hypothetical protein